MRLLIVGLTALGMLTVIVGGATADDPKPTGKKLTSEQQAKLKERDRLDAEARKLQAAGQLDEAVAAAQKKLVIEREVLGPVHADIAVSLATLGFFAEQKEDFVAARGYRQESLSLRERLHGKDHWQTTDARLELQTLRDSRKTEANRSTTT